MKFFYHFDETPTGGAYFGGLGGGPLGKSGAASGI